MMRTRTQLVALAIASLLAACDEPPLIEVDASVELDAGADGGADAGAQPDAELPRVDAGSDAGPPPSALVRFLHVAPGMPTVDLRADGRIERFDVYYRAATPYQRVPVGEGVLSVTDAAMPDSEPLATSAAQTFEDGARYLAVLTQAGDESAITIVEESAPDTGAPFSMRVLNATHDTADLDVDLDGSALEIEVSELAAGGWSDWIAADPALLRPMVIPDDAPEPFTVDDTVAPWLEGIDRALLVVTGRPVEARPSEPDGLSIVLVLEATESASPFFILRPDPHLAILQASPLLAPAEVTANPSSGGDPIAITGALAYGEMISTRLPPGRSFVRFRPEGESFGEQDSVDLLPGHRYLMVTHGNPDGSPRFEATTVREAIEGDGFVLINASPDTPGAMRWYTETSPDAWAALEPIMAYGERSPARGVALDPAHRLGVAREDRSAPNVWFDAPSAPQARGFVVLAGSYFAAPAAPEALTAFWVWAPPDGSWELTRTSPGAGSGPLPDETAP